MTPMQYERPLLQTLRKRLSRPTSVIHVMIGPRQAGKTTLSRQLERGLPFPAIFASADSPVPLDHSWIETHWRRATNLNVQVRKPILLVLDEVQKVPGWSETVKILWDARQPEQDIRVLLLGSSSLIMQDGLTESLAGRFFLHRCGHWNFSECREAFDMTLDQWLFFGGYPGAVPFMDDISAWKQYICDSLIETVLARDVLQMARVAKPALLRHLFALAATMPAQIISFTKLLGQLQDAGNTTTLAHYLQLLERAFLLSGLELFSHGRQRKRGSSPKLLLWNNALVNALSTRSFEEAAADGTWWGRIVENAVGGVFSNCLAPVEYSLTYWRDGPAEVDFVVSRGQKTTAIEVKSGRGGKTAGLSAFRKQYPKADALMIGASGIPLEEFFEQDPHSFLA